MAPNLTLDHVFAFVPDGDAAARALHSAGLVVTRQRRHQRQGTQNLCARFGPAFLELLWVVDPAELRSPAVRKTGLWARSQWRRTGACPFGVCLRGQPTWPTWPYSVLFPPGLSVEMDDQSADARHPLVFAFAQPAASPPTIPAQPMGSAITGVTLAYPAAPRPVGPVASALRGAGVHEEPGRPLLTLTVDDGRRGEEQDLPEVALRLRW